MSQDQPSASVLKYDTPWHLYKWHSAINLDSSGNSYSPGMLDPLTKFPGQFFFPWKTKKHIWISHLLFFLTCSSLHCEKVGKKKKKSFGTVVFIKLYLFYPALGHHFGVNKSCKPFILSVKDCGPNPDTSALLCFMITVTKLPHPTH